MDGLRNNWLNPPEWTRTEVLEFPGTADGPWRRYFDPNSVPDAGSVRDTAASFYHSLGIDAAREYHTPTGRPIAIVRNGTVVEELFT